MNSEVCKKLAQFSLKIINKLYSRNEELNEDNIEQELENIDGYMQLSDNPQEFEEKKI